jgi:hypothetical protein
MIALIICAPMLAWLVLVTCGALIWKRRTDRAGDFYPQSEPIHAPDCECQFSNRRPHVNANGTQQHRSNATSR